MRASVVRAATPPEPRVLLAMAHDKTRRGLAEALDAAGYRAMGAATARGALGMARRHTLHAAILDLALPGCDGLALLDALTASQPGLRVIALAFPVPIDLVVATVQHGAADVLTKPVRPRDLVGALERLAPRSHGEARAHATLDPTQEMERLGILGRSARMREVFERVLRIAPHYRTVLVLGESGAGKEIISRALHALGPGGESPFVAVNCATLSEALLESEIFGHEGGPASSVPPRMGMMEAADGGTLFLDQVHEIGLPCQGKLLRAVERREFRRVGGLKKIKVDVRLIATANVDLEEWVAQKRFRADLYYRLKVLTISLPPLRERKEAIPILAQRFLADVARANRQQQKRLTPAALAQLVRHDWPGNVRELRHTIEDLALVGTRDVVDAGDLPENVRRARPTAIVIPAGTSLAEAERRLILRTLETQSTVKDAARVLGIGLRTLHTKLRQYGLRRRG